ncbi:MAG: hypothetical protein QOC93_2996 [Actinomycetota bacterium]|jgi:hypothetical protein|nr:hypothetical protein [Actinomycetota bacterium]
MDDTYVFDPAHDIGIRPHADRTHPPVLNPTAADLMSRSVVAAHANDPVDMAWNLMRWPGTSCAAWTSTTFRWSTAGAASDWSTHPPSPAPGSNRPASAVRGVPCAR